MQTIKSTFHQLNWKNINNLQYLSAHEDVKKEACSNTIEGNI